MYEVRDGCCGGCGSDCCGSGVSNLPVSMLNMVVLPAPLWPSIAVIWPSYTDSEKSFTACVIG